MSKGIEKNNYALLTIVALLLMIGQKIAIHFAGFEFSIALFVYLFFVLVLFKDAKIIINTKRFIMYILMVFSCTFSLFFNSNFSTTSILFLICIYAILCFDLKLNLREQKHLLTVFKNIIFISAIIGILQFTFQLIGINYFDLFDLLPQTVKLSGFNTYYPISYGSTIIKSNGWIYQEPSFFSQFLAIGIILELNEGVISFKKIFKLIIYVLALFFSFSGTGLLMILFYAIPVFLKLPRKPRIIITVCAILLMLILLNSEYAEAILSRFDEFGNANTSAGIRFLNPFVVVGDMPLIEQLFGNGPGSGDAVSTYFNINFNPFLKMLYEYGCISMILFLIFISTVFLKKGVSIFSLSLLLMFLFLSGSLLQPSIVFVLTLMIELDYIKLKSNSK